MMGKKFGVFACQGGPGAENSYGGIAQAFSDSVPILFIPDGIPLINSDVSPSFISSKNFEDITKWSKSINHAERIVSLMKRAFHSLKNGRPSPVLIEMHRDHMGQEVSNLEEYKSPKESKVCPTDDFIEEAVKLIINSKKPIIWSGQGVLYSSATKELEELSNLLSLPVVTTMPGKS